jgi:hypothetical protein
LSAQLYESRLSNFHQGLSPEQKLENSAFKSAFLHQPPVSITPLLTIPQLKIRIINQITAGELQTPSILKGHRSARQRLGLR